MLPLTRFIQVDVDAALLVATDSGWFKKMITRSYLLPALPPASNFCDTDVGGIGGYEYCYGCDCYHPPSFGRAVAIFWARDHVFFFFLVCVCCVRRGLLLKLAIFKARDRVARFSVWKCLES
jgi:hypothetical protein